MNASLKIYYPLALFFCCIRAEGQHAALLSSYPSVIEKLLFFKFDSFKVFYGGLIDRKDKGVRWIMPVAFENEFHKTRAVYEIAFINCGLRDACDAEILFVEVSDINIRLKNTLSRDYAVFSSLLNGDYKDEKYIVIRFSEIANLYYPDIFVFAGQGERSETDKSEIVKFLYKQFKTQSTYKDFYTGEISNEVYHEDEQEIIYNPIQAALPFEGVLHSFSVVKRIKKNDIWKAYYVISRADKNLSRQDSSDYVLLRLDSGCVSGQIYDDEACDCLDQLHDALKQLAKDDTAHGIIIHIPAHDGRGFGTAPKAETEIYKRGGKGRVHSTVALDTVTAAKLLYGVDHYDLRSFDGAAQILSDMNIKKVLLLTDNVEKVSALQRYGIEVLRQKTDTNKASCLKHIEAKKNNELYFSE